MFNTFIKPDKPVARAMRTTRSTLRLRAKNGQLPEIPSAGSQRVERAADGASATVTIDVSDSLAATSAEQADAQYLAPTPLANSDDEMIRKLAARAVKDAGDSSMARAEALRKYVHNHVSRKGMDTAFASASETAVTRRGDCSEHGVLLCAMLRAEKIPARVACGLLYVDDFAGASDIFGWHMWTQALVDGKWVDLDATLPRRYHALHVLTNLSSLADGAMSTEMANVITMMGNLDIDVLEVGYDESPPATTAPQTPEAPDAE
jgi:transglutaminase-like putative cysteine protease